MTSRTRHIHTYGCLKITGGKAEIVCGEPVDPKTQEFVDAFNADDEGKFRALCAELNELWMRV